MRNFTIEGNNPNTGTSIYDPGGENQQGVAIYGGTRIEIANTTIRKTWGDAVYADEKDTTHSWVDGLWVHDNTFRSIGRTAFTMNGARNALIERNNVDRSAARSWTSSPTPPTRVRPTSPCVTTPSASTA